MPYSRPAIRKSCRWQSGQPHRLPDHPVDPVEGVARRDDDLPPHGRVANFQERDPIRSTGSPGCAMSLTRRIAYRPRLVSSTFALGPVGDPILAGILGVPVEDYDAEHVEGGHRFSDIDVDRVPHAVQLLAGQPVEQVPRVDHLVGEVAEVAEPAGTGAAEQRDKQFGADIGELVADEGRPPVAGNRNLPSFGYALGRAMTRSSGLSAS